MKKLFTILFFCVLIAGGVLFTFRTKHPAHIISTTNQTITLPIQTLKEQSFTYIKSFIGSVEATQSVAIVPYLSAFLKEVLVRSGAEVTKGETLFLLDDKIPLANLNQAKEAVDQAFAKRENAKIYYERMKNTNPKAISSTDLEQAKTEYDSAESAYQKALAAQNQAQTLFNYTIIQAPISGWVGDITATIGEYLSPESGSLANVVGFSPVRLVFAVPMSTYQNTPLSDDKATLQVVLADQQTLDFTDFTVVRNNQADKNTDSLSFFVDVKNDTKRLIPGSYIEVRFLYPKQGILVNKNWITLTPDGAEATLLQDNIIKKQKVEIGAPIGTKYWIKSGLNEGDSIITVPISPFQIGQPAKGIPQ